MRKLASIQKIVDLQPIPNADKIEVATVLGWKCVVKKDEFRVGDLCIYIEIDSIVPDNEYFAFMKERKFRVKTIKLRGQVSQGLVVPLEYFKNPRYHFNEGLDLTDVMGIKKYDPQGELEEKLAKEKLERSNNKIKKFLSRYSWFRNMFKNQSGAFPSFIKKTDEPRIQLFPDICEKYKGIPFQYTEKVDGQSATYFLLKKKRFLWLGKKYIFGVCSRNVYLPKRDSSAYWSIAVSEKLEESLLKLQKFFDAKLVVIQGEIIGPKIQGDKYGCKDHYRFFVFNVIIDDEKFVEIPWMWKVFRDRDIDLETVPLIMPKETLLESIDQMVQYASGKSMIADIQREGIVVRNE